MKTLRVCVKQSSVTTLCHGAHSATQSGGRYKFRHTCPAHICTLHPCPTHPLHPSSASLPHLQQGCLHPFTASLPQPPSAPLLAPTASLFPPTFCIPADVFQRVHVKHVLIIFSHHQVGHLCTQHRVRHQYKSGASNALQKSKACNTLPSGLSSSPKAVVSIARLAHVLYSPSAHSLQTLIDTDVCSCTGGS